MKLSEVLMKRPGTVSDECFCQGQHSSCVSSTWIYVQKGMCSFLVESGILDWPCLPSAPSTPFEEKGRSAADR